MNTWPTTLTRGIQFLILAFFALGIVGINPCLADENKSEASGSKDSNLLFQSNDILHFTLLGEFDSLMRDRGEDGKYHKGLLYYFNNQGDTIDRKVKVKARGNFRRRIENCKYPPLKIKFKKLKSPDSIFTDQTTLKLVLECQLEKYVMMEYLAYRIYNAITDDSYRVRLVMISYGDYDTDVMYLTRPGFLIENEKELMERMNAESVKKNVLQNMLDRKSVVTMAMFQYMIGNDDWFVTSKHNMTVVEKNSNETMYAVPYDFDWSKLVDASYTKPEGAQDYQLEERRTYKGLCLTEEEFQEQKDLFLAKKEEILATIEGETELKKKYVNTARRHVLNFYKILERPKSLEDIFQQDKCQKDVVFDQ